MKNIVLLLMMVAMVSAKAQPKPEVNFGFNNSRLMELLTDSKGILIPEKIDQLKKIPSSINKVARWPHGAAGRTYDVDLPGYGDGKGKITDKNYIHEFTRLCKIMNWSVVICLNVTPEYLNPEKTNEWQQKNMKTIQIFVDSGIPILAVEVGGNESNMHMVLPGIKGEYQDKPGLINKLLKTNERYEIEMLKYYSISKAYNQLVKSKFSNLKTAATYGAPLNARDRRWNVVMSDLPTDMGVFHWYENATDVKSWEDNFKKQIEAIVISGKIPICTEYAFNFGPYGEDNKAQSSTGINDKYCDFFQRMCQKYGVYIALRHRIAGSEKTPNPYDYLLIK